MGEVGLRVLDLDATLAHYKKLIGLNETMRDREGRVYLKAWDEHDHHSLVLREADEAGVDYVAFKVVDDATLTETERKVGAYGLAVERIEAGVYPKSGRRIEFRLPSGHRVQLYAEKEQIGNGIATVNPDVLPDEGVIHGIGPTRLDHALLYGPNIAENVKIFQTVLGFRLTEKVLDDQTKEIRAAFLSCSNKAHDVAFIAYPEPGKLHHVSFYLESVQDIYHAGDLMGKHGTSVDIGPTRHGITRGATIYFFDPSGNRNEVFSGGYIYYPDNPTLTWYMSELGKGVFYPTHTLNERFLTVVT
jgi:catechol 2,3-dioxygenase